jgi:hypothetical protein
VCGSSLTASARQNALSRLRFEHCCEHTVIASLGAEAREKLIFGNDRQACETYMDAMLELDALAESITCKFSEVLKRYDCSQPYSVNFHCADCKVGLLQPFQSGRSFLFEPTSGDKTSAL